MPNKFANIKAQDGLSRTQQKRLVKKAAKNAKYTNPLNAGPTRTTAMTPNQRRRDRELIFLNLRPAILPKGLFPRYSALLNRRIEMMTTDKARYEHDLARRNAIGRVMQERIKEGIDYKDDLANWQRVLQVEDLTAWREKKEEHTAWIIRKLEEKCSTKHNTGFVSTIEGRLAVYRDLLHVTLQLDNKGGIPEGAVPWLRSCFTSDASKRAGDDRAFASWALAVKQAVNYIAACRRKAGVVGVFEQTHRHRGHKIEVFASWSKEELEQEEWVCRDGILFSTSISLFIS